MIAKMKSLQQTTHKGGQKMDVKDLMLEKGVKPSVTRLAIYDYLL